MVVSCLLIEKESTNNLIIDKPTTNNFLKMLKKIIFTLLAICSLLNTNFAQQVQFDTLITTLDEAADFEDYLVSLAWINNPANRILDHNINIAESDIKIARRDWANDIALTFNLNENNLARRTSLTKESIVLLEDAGLGYLADLTSLGAFPRYNLGVSFNLGRLITLPKNVDVAKERLEIEKVSLDQQKMEIRSAVLRLYQAHTQAFEIYKIRKKAEQDAEEIFQLMKSRFREGTVKFEEFSRSSSSLQDSRESVIDAQGELDLTELLLEEMIGITLEQAREYFGS